MLVYTTFENMQVNGSFKNKVFQTLPVECKEDWEQRLSLGSENWTVRKDELPKLIRGDTLQESLEQQCSLCQRLYKKSCATFPQLRGCFRVEELKRRKALERNSNRAVRTSS